MRMNYRSLINEQAMRSLEKTVYHPETRLGVGHGEELAPLPNIVSYPHVFPAVVMPDPNHRSIEQATIDGYNDPVTDKDFPKSLYYGEALGGI